MNLLSPHQSVIAFLPWILGIASTLQIRLLTEYSWVEIWFARQALSFITSHIECSVACQVLHSCKRVEAVPCDYCDQAICLPIASNKLWAYLICTLRFVMYIWLRYRPAQSNWLDTMSSAVSRCNDFMWGLLCTSNPKYDVQGINDSNWSPSAKSQLRQTASMQARKWNRLLRTMISMIVLSTLSLTVYCKCVPQLPRWA